MKTLTWTASISGDSIITEYSLYRAIDTGAVPAVALSFSLVDTFPVLRDWDASVLEEILTYLDADATVFGYTYHYYVEVTDAHGRVARSNTISLALESQPIVAAYIDAIDGGVIKIDPLDGAGPYTMSGWLRVENEADDPGLVWVYAQGADLVLYSIELLVDSTYGFSFRSSIGPSLTPFDSSPLGGVEPQWFFFFIQSDGTNIEAGWMDPLYPTFFPTQRVTGLPGQGVANGFVTQIGAGSIFPEMTGGVAQIRQWAAYLSEAELVAEMQSSTYVRSANIWSSNPMNGGADTSDETGNNRESGPTVSLTDTDGPPNG